jgi:hypothetical protein
MSIRLHQPPEQWAEKYGLKIKSGVCLNCKQEIMIDEPFAIKGYRGFRMKDHGCPKEYNHTYIIPWDKEEKDFWASHL